MDDMKKATQVLRLLPGLALLLALAASATMAQQPEAKPSPSPQKSADARSQSSAPKAGDSKGSDYTVISSIEIGYRGLRVDGDLNKYQSDLNYKTGPRLFDTSFLLKSKEGGKGALLDELLVTSTGWGGDPYGNVRFSAENSRWFRLDGQFRKFQYFNFLDNFANPNASSSNGSVVVPASQITGKQGFNVNQKVGDFNLVVLPKNEKFNFTFGYSPESYKGLTYTTYHAGGGEFFLPALSDSHENEFRVGADWKLGPVSFSFLQGFRRFTDTSAINFSGVLTNYLATSATNVATVNSFVRQQPTKGSTDYSRFTAHTFLARKLDLTGRFVYSRSTSNVNFLESITGVNYNTRAANPPGVNYAPPNVLTSGTLTYNDKVNKPNILGEFGATFLATDKLRFSNTLRVESYHINGATFYNSAFFLSRNGTALPPILAGPDLGTSKVTSFRKITDTVEGDYQFNDRYAVRFGYTRGYRRDVTFYDGYNPGAVQTARVPAPENNDVEENHTNVFFGGFKARPFKTWTVYFDAARGTADNIFTRVGEYNYTNIRARSRWTPTRKLTLNFSFVTKDNSDPTVVDGVSIADFGVSTKSRVFTSSIDYEPSARVSFSAGYDYNWVNSDAVINYAYAVPPATTTQGQYTGHSLYFMRNNYFYADAVVHLFPKWTLYGAYRINKDTGQGNQLSNPTGGLLVTSYPMSYQSPETRLSYRFNRRLEWNVGYQYYAYNESDLVRIGQSVRPQNYHAHLPYASLRIYFGRIE
jgi:hypothetical protein